jgi:hypothetical protein
MRYPPLLWILIASTGMGLAACGASTDDYADSTDDADDADARDAPRDGTPEDEAALIRQAAIQAGIPIPDEEIPVVSERTYTTGHIQLKVTGQFDIDASPALDTQASISSGDYTWIQYGASGGEAPNATVTIGNGDIGISVAVGRFVATGTTTECEMTTNVTPTSVSGHFICPKVTGYNQGDRTMGNVTIELDFEASS